MRTLSAMLVGFALGSVFFAALSAAQNSGPNWKLEDDRMHVTVTFPTNPPAVLRLDVADVVDLLSHLGDFRSVMWPEEPKIYELGQRVAVIPDPIWSTEPDRDRGDTLLHIRDPRYGWLHYMIPREEARKLAGYILDQVYAPPPAQQPTKQ
jgi:hypothetical protein